MNKKTVVVISREVALTGICERLLVDAYQCISFRNIQSAIDYIYNSIPDLVILDSEGQDQLTLSVLNNLKSDPIFHQLPVLVVLEDEQKIPDWKTLFVEDYIRKSKVEQEGISRVDLSILRSERVTEVNPLTKLPGNISINKQIQDKIDNGSIFSLAYADLDNFKPFNDYYGFSRGDEVIRIAGRLILNIVKNKQYQGSFIGHIGGDDFVFILDVNVVEEATKEIIETFDRIMPTLYDPEDRERGCIETEDRQGNIRQFPLITISIGITSNFQRFFTHYGEITEIASEMKSLAKAAQGSCYRMDRRR